MNYRLNNSQTNDRFINSYDPEQYYLIVTVKITDRMRDTPTREQFIIPSGYSRPTKDEISKKIKDCPDIKTLTHPDFNDGVYCVSYSLITPQKSLPIKLK